MILIQTSNDNTNWTTLKTPAKFEPEFEDIDVDSYRSVSNGNLIRRRLKPRWVKIGVSWPILTDAECDTIARAVNTNSEIWVRCKAPCFGNMVNPETSQANDFFKFKAYVSKYQCSAIRVQDGLRWTMSFNIVQSKVGDWQ